MVDATHQRRHPRSTFVELPDASPELVVALELPTGTTIEAQKRTIAEERARTEEILKRELGHQVAERSRELGHRIVSSLGAGGMGTVYEVERRRGRDRRAESRSERDGSMVAH